MTLGSDSICKLLRTGGREAVQRCVDRDASGIGEGWEGGVSTEIPPWLLQVLAEIPRWSLALDLPTPPSLPYRPPLLNHVSPHPSTCASPAANEIARRIVRAGTGSGNGAGLGQLSHLRDGTGTQCADGKMNSDLHLSA